MSTVSKILGKPERERGKQSEIKEDCIWVHCEKIKGEKILREELDNSVKWWRQTLLFHAIGLVI